MKKATMKGRSVDDAVKAALEVLGGEKENAKITIIKAGKAGMLGVIGGEEAEVEVTLREGKLEDSKKVLQEILDKMMFTAMVEAKEEDDRIELAIKGEDMGRMIGKEGATLRSLEILVGSIVSRMYDERVRVGVDAGDYKEKRKQALERVANDAAEEVASSGKEKVLPPMTAGDRRIIHMVLKEMTGVETISKGEGRDRRLVISPKQ